MSKLAISESPTTITAVDQTTAKLYTITNTQPNWSKVVEAIKKEGNDDEIIQLISVKGAIENFSTSGNIKVIGNDVFYKTHRLAGLDVDHLLEAIRTGNRRQAKALTLFLENKQLNPSYRSVNSMYKFRQDRGMPLTDDGCFLAYKGVNENYWSIWSNKNTIVLSGEVDEQGHIHNTIGSYIEVDRKCVVDDPAQACAEGLHVGSIEYATGHGQRVIIVKVNPKDVVSVPDDEDTKMRVCAYQVIGECEGRMPEHFSEDLDNDSLEDNCCPECGECYGEFYDGEYCGCCGYDSSLDFPLDEEEEEEDIDGEDDTETQEKQNYGWNDGVADGRAHKRRKYYNGEEKTPDGSSFFPYIKGYNDGYNWARYGK